jgi:hypothetical protein
MRPRILYGTLLVAAMLVGAAALISTALRRPPAAAPGDNETGPPTSATPSVQPPLAASPESAPPAGPAAVTPVSGTDTNALSDETHVEYVSQRVRELMILGMQSDIVSRDTILSELRNSDREIRKAAVDAAIQFSDRSVVPRLKEVAAETQDPAEKAELLEAIEYINLPSLTEYLAEQRAREAGAGRTNALQRLPNRPATPALAPTSPSAP